MRNLNDLNQHRAVDWELRAMGAVGDANGGCFLLDCHGIQLAVMASSGGGWDHISVSTPQRCPTWLEMEHARKLFAKPHEVWMQFGVPTKDHINCHPYCLHWWRPLHREVRLPPSEFVGPRTA